MRKLDILKRKLKRNKRKAILISILIWLLYVTRFHSFLFIHSAIQLVQEHIELVREHIEINWINAEDGDEHDHRQRYIMFRCDQVKDKHDCGGFGDRLKGILSAYLWSLLDDRQFIVQVNRPCDMVNLLEPNEVNWNRDVPNDIGWWQTAEIDFRYCQQYLKITIKN